MTDRRPEMTTPETGGGNRPLEEEVRDLGFGQVLAQQVRGRLVAKDGTPNSRKFGLGPQRWERFYERALATSWPTFLVWLLGLELLANGLFAFGYRALGAGAIGGSEMLGLTDPFFRAFAYSVGVFTTVGTGPLHPVGSTAVWLTVIESLLGPLSLLLSVGLVLARLVRPRAVIRFSQSAVIAPYADGRGLMFRIINVRPSEMSELRTRVNLAWYEGVDGRRQRRFYDLTLERPEVEFFNLHLTVVHPIDASSPLRGVTPESLRDNEAEILVHVSGLEDTFSTRVSARSSYYWDEVHWDARFANMFIPSPDGVATVDVERLDRFERLAEGSTTKPAPAEMAG
jgi:inward rectifier potassium channel